MILPPRVYLNYEDGKYKHYVIADIAEFRGSRSDGTLSQRIKHLDDNYKLDDNYTYSAIITSRTKGSPIVRDYLERNGLVEIASNIGGHSSRLHFYFRGAKIETLQD